MRGELKLRIAVDATCWHNRRGYGRHARSLLRALAKNDRQNRYTLFVDSTEAAEPIPENCEVRLVASDTPTVVAASASGRRSLSDMWRMSRALSAPEFDVLLFPTIYSYVPVFSRARKLVMMHDIIAETYPGLTVPAPAARFFWNLKVSFGRMQADALITVSDYSRAGILKHFRLNPASVSVVGEAADPIFRRLEDPRPNANLLRLGLDQSRPLVLYVGGFSPHKNIEALVTAFGRIAARPEFSSVVLVLVGDTTGDAFHTHYQAIADRVGALGLGNRVVFTGYLNDEDLVILLNNGSVLVLPSLMEGFGLPAVEAAACGCPVIATKESPLPQLLGEGGIYIQSREDEIVDALDTVLSSESLRSRMRDAGLAAASRLTWDAAAHQLMQIVQRVGNQ
jgi:glycosyltransferase involved in cell wall biosynthesis